VFQKK